jgi:hypothetical protein
MPFAAGRRGQGASVNSPLSLGVVGLGALGLGNHRHRQRRGWLWSAGAGLAEGGGLYRAGGFLYKGTRMVGVKVCAVSSPRNHTNLSSKVCAKSRPRNQSFQMLSAL